MYSSFSPFSKVPSAPHPTPSSVSSRSKLPKAPIHNPFDKFTQPQFDAWIGDITGALRKALGHEDEPEDETANNISPLDAEREFHASDSESQDTDEENDDSLAEIRKWRSVGKGKARDPMEGPGLGPGTLDEPIELDLDSDAEQEAGSEESYEEGSFEEDEGEQEEDEEDDVSARHVRRHNGQLSGSFTRSERRSEEEHSADEAEYEDEDNRMARSRDADEEEDEEAVVYISDREEDEENDENEQPPVEVEVESDEENDENKQPPVEVEAAGSEEEYSDEIGLATPQRKHSHIVVSVVDASRNADDSVLIEEDNDRDESGLAYPSQEDLSDGLFEEEDYEIDELEVQPSEDNTAFPVSVINGPCMQQSVSISDPWAGPQTYAEDFFSGGSVSLDSTFSITADRLNELDVGSDIGTFLTPGIMTPNSADNLSVAAADVAFQGPLPNSPLASQHALPRNLKPEIFDFLDDVEEGQKEDERHFPGSSPLPGSSPPSVCFEIESHVSPKNMLEELYGDLEDEPYNIDRRSLGPSLDEDIPNVGSHVPLHVDDGLEKHEAREEEPKLGENEEDEAEEDEIDGRELPLGTSDLDIMDAREEGKDVVETSEVEVEPASASITEALPGTAALLENTGIMFLAPEFAPESAPKEHTLQQQSDADVEIHFEYISPEEAGDEVAEIEDSAPIQIDLVSPTTVHSVQGDYQDDLEVEERPPSPIQAEPEYTVDEVLTDDEPDMNHHHADGDFDVESVAGPVTEGTLQLYEVEEVMTEGRLTVEPMDRETSLGVMSVDTEYALGEFAHKNTDPAKAPESNDTEPDEVHRVAEPRLLDGAAVLEAEIVAPVSPFTDSVAPLATNSLPTAETEAETLVAECSLRIPQQSTPIDTSERPRPDPAVIPASPASEPVEAVSVTEILDDTVSSDILPSDVVPMPETSTQDEVHPAFSPEDASEHTFLASGQALPEPTTNSLPGTTKLSDSADSPIISLVPEHVDLDQIDMFTERSEEKVDQVAALKASLPHRLPSTAEVVMTRTSSIPVLHADPYPASLSTPGMDLDSDGDDEESTDEELGRDENDIDTSISSATDEEKGEVQLPEQAEDRMSLDLDLELQYPSAPENLSTDDNVEQGGDDSDAEGDLDPDFYVGADGVITPATSTREDSLGNEEPAEGVTQPSSVASAVDKNEVQEVATVTPPATGQANGLSVVSESGPLVTSAELSSPPSEGDISGRTPEPIQTKEPVEASLQVEEGSHAVDAADHITDSDNPGVSKNNTPAEKSVSESTDIDTAGAAYHEKDTVADGTASNEDTVAADLKKDIVTNGVAARDDTVVNGAADHSKDSVLMQKSSNDQELTTSDPSSDEATKSTSAATHQTPGDTEAQTIKAVAEKESGISSAASNNARRSKRKRNVPVRLLEASLSTKQSLKRGSASVDPKNKGKRKRLRQGSQTPSSSSASSAAKLLQPGSRASSIVSTSTGDGSALTQPSPTLARLQAGPSGPPPPPPPPPPFMPQLMFHNHGRPRIPPPQNRPSLTLQTQVQRQVARAPSISRPSASQQQSPVAGPSSQPSPSSHVVIQATSVHREGPPSNSPVTRSHCRYHKISLPEEEEDGPHIFFLVPGCSLVDRKVMREEDIEDHGDATYEDSLRKVDDIETLGINEYVIGVIRLLVGPDKEHEVYFLPKPGEERARKVVHRRSTLSRSSWKDLSGPGVGGSPRASNGNIFSPTSSRAPLSIAGSTSTNKSSKRRPQDDDAETFSLSSGSLTETESDDSQDEYDGSPDAKRPKLHSQAEDGSIAPQSLQATRSIGKTTKRIRRLAPDAAAYKPEEDGSEEESLDESSKRKKPAKRKSLKRARTSEVGAGGGGDDGERKSKKSKTYRIIQTPPVPPVPASGPSA